MLEASAEHWQFSGSEYLNERVLVRIEQACGVDVLQVGGLDTLSPACLLPEKSTHLLEGHGKARGLMNSDDCF